MAFRVRMSSFLTRCRSLNCGGVIRLLLGKWLGWCPLLRDIDIESRRLLVGRWARPVLGRRCPSLSQGFYDTLIWCLGIYFFVFNFNIDSCHLGLAQRFLFNALFIFLLLLLNWDFFSRGNPGLFGLFPILRSSCNNRGNNTLFLACLNFNSDIILVDVLIILLLILKLKQTWANLCTELRMPFVISDWL